MRSSNRSKVSASASAAPVPGAVQGAPAGGFTAVEAALAGLALCPDNGKTLDLLAAAVEPGSTRTAHGRLLETALAIHRAGRPVDLLTVSSRLDELTMDAIGGPMALNRLVDGAPPQAHVAFHLEEWRSMGRVRRLAFALETGRLDLESGRAPDAVVATVRRALEDGAPPPVVFDACEWFNAAPPPPVFLVDGTIEAGDKGSIIAKSKERKSFFALQLAICTASGTPFLCWDVPSPARVLLVQFEIKAVHFQRRFRFMCTAMQIDRHSLGDRLAVANLRGWGRTGPDAVAELGMMARQHNAQLVIIDPLYKVTEGDENSARDLKPTLAAFDRMAEAGAAVCYVHHDAKGDAGSRDIRDRGAGSGVTGRDDDFRFTLCTHDTEEGGAVLETMRRNFKPHDPVTVQWDDTGCFRYLPGVAPVKRDPRRAGKAPDRPSLDTLIDSAVALVKSKPLSVPLFRGKLYRLAGTQARVRELFGLLVSDGHLHELHARGRGRHEAWIGTEKQIETLRQRTFEE